MQFYRVSSIWEKPHFPGVGKNFFYFIPRKVCEITNFSGSFDQKKLNFIKDKKKGAARAESVAVSAWLFNF